MHPGVLNFVDMPFYKIFFTKNLNSPNDVQKCVWASSVLLHLLCGMFQTRKLLSSEADSKYLPPGCQDRPRIQLSCPTRVKRHRPEDTSHTLIDLSREPEAKKGPEMKIKVIIDGFLPGQKMNMFSGYSQLWTASWNRNYCSRSSRVDQFSGQVTSNCMD